MGRSRKHIEGCIPYRSTDSFLVLQGIILAPGASKPVIHAFGGASVGRLLRAPYCNRSRRPGRERRLRSLSSKCATASSCTALCVNIFNRGRARRRKYRGQFSRPERTFPVICHLRGEKEGTLHVPRCTRSSLKDTRTADNRRQLPPLPAPGLRAYSPIKLFPLAPSSFLRLSPSRSIRLFTPFRDLLVPRARQASYRYRTLSVRPAGSSRRRFARPARSVESIDVTAPASRRHRTPAVTLASTAND